MRLVDNLFERVSGWLGLEVDDPPTDTLATALAPYEHADRSDGIFEALRRANPVPPATDRVTRIFESLRSTCEHYHYAGVDDSPNRPEKVWECDACGWLFRIVVNPEKPWFVRELVGVDALSASHAVSDATVSQPPSPATAASDAPAHIDLDHAR